MASIQVRKETGTLIIDFYFQGTRCREQTALSDTPNNRKRLSKVVSKIEEEITLGSFNYRDFFPNSKNALKFDQATPDLPLSTAAQVISGLEGKPTTPLFKDFACIWFSEKSIEWRKSHQRTVQEGVSGILCKRGLN